MDKLAFGAKDAELAMVPYSVAVAAITKAPGDRVGRSWLSKRRFKGYTPPFDCGRCGSKE